MKTFRLHRIEDEGGVSGTGCVAEGVVFDSGWCAMAWLTEHTSVAFYTSLAEVVAIHGHNGKTRVVVEPDYLATLLLVSTDLAQDALESPIGYAEREAAGFYRLGRGAVDAVRAAIASATGSVSREGQPSPGEEVAAAAPPFAAPASAQEPSPAHGGPLQDALALLETAHSKSHDWDVTTNCGQACRYPAALAVLRAVVAPPLGEQDDDKDVQRERSRKETDHG